MDQLTAEALAEMIDEDERLYEMAVQEKPKIGQGFKNEAKLKLENEVKLAEMLPEWGRLPDVVRSQTRRIYAHALHLTETPETKNSFIQVRIIQLGHSGTVTLTSSSLRSTGTQS